MKKLFLFGILLSCASLFAEGPGWETDLEAAKIRAEKEDKTILLNFTGSDWCGWCKKLSREVFRKKEFQEFAQEKLILVEVDFPRHKKMSSEQKRKNYQLQSKYRVRGYPTILLVDHNEKVLLSTGYVPGGAESYIAHLKKAMN